MEGRWGGEAAAIFSTSGTAVPGVELVVVAELTLGCVVISVITKAFDVVTEADQSNDRGY